MAAYVHSSKQDARQDISKPLDERLSLVDAKSVLSFFAERIPRIGKDIVKDVCHFALASIQPRIVSFEEQVV
uniref:Uncharacterized protein n=1 Tax=Amphimedon queenslandica TaxID=400682 RepID=A0A1X7U4E7_AMPQE